MGIVPLRREHLLLLALPACAEPYVYLGELPSQPNEVALGKFVAVDAASGSAAQVRLLARGGSIAVLNGEATNEALCFALEEGALDTIIQVYPANVECAVSAELVSEGECSSAAQAGPASVLVVRSGAGSNSTTDSSSGSGGGDMGGGVAGTGGAGGGT